MIQIVHIVCFCLYFNLYYTDSNVNLHNILGKDVNVEITPSHILCEIKGSLILDGELFDNVIVDESTWSVEDKKLVRILLTKSIKREGMG